MVQIQNKVESASCVNVFFYTNSNTYTVTRLAQNILRHAHETTYKKKEKKKMKKKSIVFNILIFSQTAGSQLFHFFKFFFERMGGVANTNHNFHLTLDILSQAEKKLGGGQTSSGRSGHKKYFC